MGAAFTLLQPVQIRPAAAATFPLTFPRRRCPRRSPPSASLTRTSCRPSLSTPPPVTPAQGASSAAKGLCWIVVKRAPAPAAGGGLAQTTRRTSWLPAVGDAGDREAVGPCSYTAGASPPAFSPGLRAHPVARGQSALVATDALSRSLRRRAA